MKISQRTFAISGFIALFLFVFLTIAVVGRSFQQFDYTILTWLQNNTSRSLDSFFVVLTLIGSLEISSILIFAVLLIERKKRDLIALFFYVVSLLVEVIGKNFIYRPGLPAFFFGKDITLGLPSYAVTENYTYPSGHTFRAVFASILFLRVIWNSKKMTLPMKILFTIGTLAFVLFMAYSRVSLVKHWPLDVAGGVLLGLATGLLFLAFTY